MWITHVKMKCFCWEEKMFLGQEGREYIDSRWDFLRENEVILTIMLMETD